MPQYLMSIYQPGGRHPRPDVMALISADLHRLNEELRAAGAWVFAGGLHPPSTATVVRAQRRRCADHRRPVRRGQGAHRRVHDHQGARPRRRARVGRASSPGRPRCRSRCGRSRTRPADAARAGAPRLGDRARLPRGVRPRGGRPGPRLRRHRRRRGGGPGRVHRGGAALAVDRRCRRARPAGSSPPPATGRSTACAARRRATDRHAAGRARCTPASEPPTRRTPCATTGCA